MITELGSELVVVAVGAVDQHGKLAEFTPSDAEERGLPWVTVTAPGVDIKSAYVDAEVESVHHPTTRFDGWAQWSGTARTLPWVKSARQALGELLPDPNSYVWKSPYTS